MRGGWDANIGPIVVETRPFRACLSNCPNPPDPASDLLQQHVFVG